MRSAVESYGFTLHFFNYNPYSIVNEPEVAKTNAELESQEWTRAHRLSRGFALLICCGSGTTRTPV